MFEKNRIDSKIFVDVNACLDRAGLMMHSVMIVVASLIVLPRSTKNRGEKRDPEMYQTKKGNELYFRMKVHASADAGSRYVYTIISILVNMRDASEMPILLREDDRVGYGDLGYLVAPNRPEKRTMKYSQRLSSVSTSGLQAAKWLIISKVLAGTRRWSMENLLYAVK